MQPDVEASQPGSDDGEPDVGDGEAPDEGVGAGLVDGVSVDVGNAGDDGEEDSEGVGVSSAHDAASPQKATASARRTAHASPLDLRSIDQGTHVVTGIVTSLGDADPASGSACWLSSHGGDERGGDLSAGEAET